MSTYENKIYISYALKGESENLVNKIDESLQKRGVVIVRDKRDLGYKGSIKEFMEQIGKGLCVIVVISDKYLKSPNCMFELVEIAENKQFHTRIFPVVLSDANIYDPIQRLEYVKYWEDQRQKLADAMRTVDPANLHGIRDDIDNYTRFRAEISELVSTLKDMNTLTPEMHKDSDFNELFMAIERNFKGEYLVLDTSHQIKINDLIGILMPPEEEESETTKEIARYAFAQVKNSVDSDIFSNPDEGIISTLVWNLLNLDVNPDKCPAMLAFAVLCHDHAAGLKQEEVKKQLEIWIDEACLNTSFSLASIRALYPRQDYSRIHRLSIEIA